MVLIKGPEREAKGRVKLSGLIYKASWNKDNEYTFKSGKYRVLIKGDFSKELTDLLQASCIVEIEAKLEIPRGPTNPKEFSYDNYLLSKKIHYVAYVKEADIKVIEKGKFSLRKLSANIRYKINKSLERYFIKEDSGLIFAIMVGDSYMLDDEIKSNIRLSGIAHLLAVSGSHVFMFLFPFDLLFKNRFFNLWIRKLLLIIPLLFFCLVTGSSPSVFRAVFFMIFKILGLAFNKKVDSLNLLSLVGLIQILINPYSIYSISFILTYASAFSIILIYPIIKSYFYSLGFSSYKKGDGRGRGIGAYEKSKILSLNMNSLFIGSAVNLGILPIMTNYFNSLNLIGLFVTILASPIASFILVLAYLLSLFDNIGIGFLGRILSYFLKFFIHLLNFFTDKARFLPRVFTDIRCPSRGISLYLAYYTILIYFMFKLKGKQIDKRIQGKIILGILAILLIFNQPMSQIVFYDVGQGNSFYIESKDGKRGLIDTGEGFANMSTLLLKNGVSLLDYVILSHGHSDHVGDIYNIIENHKIKKLFVPKNEYDIDISEIAYFARKAGIEVYYVDSYIGYRPDKWTRLDISVNIDS